MTRAWSPTTTIFGPGLRVEAAQAANELGRTQGELERKQAVLEHLGRVLGAVLVELAEARHGIAKARTIVQTGDAHFSANVRGDALAAIERTLGPIDRKLAALERSLGREK